jgi:Ser/Thr protein kinase RdoA (MazF antagonist)
MSRRGEYTNASQAGHALALLDQALASLPEIAAVSPPDAKNSMPFGDFAQRYPQIPDPLIAVQKLPIDREQSQRLVRILAHVIGGVGDLYARLPQQLVHRDMDTSNLLFDAQGVTAVLDFEFAALDLRVLDLCVTLSWWPLSRMGTGTEWEIFDALGRSYMATFPLEEDELLAMPEILQLRDAASLLHRIGRYRAGQISISQIQERVQHSLWRDTWLSAQRKVLLEHALSWHHAAS